MVWTGHLMGMDINGESQQVTEEKVWVVPKYGGD